MTLPNFFIVGAPKAGTDELYYDLDQHPQIYMSPLKEPCYFSSEIRIDNFDEALRPRAAADAESLRAYLDSGTSGKRFGGIVTTMGDYQRLFLQAEDEIAIGEGSVCYLWSACAASVIAKTVPSARIIIVLMDPAERAFHQYLKSLADGNVTHSFHTHLQMAFQDKGQKLSIYHPFLDFGNYAEQVRRYMAWFPPEQIHISFYEDRERDPGAWFKSTLSFLGVEDSFVPRPAEIPSKPHFVRSSSFGNGIDRLGIKPLFAKVTPNSVKLRIRNLLYVEEKAPTLSAEDRALLVSYYRDNILELQDILSCDLSAWLRCQSVPA